MKVVKFGGSSLANAEQVKKVCEIVMADVDRRVVVVSAPGKRHGGDTKVTDLLIACANCRQAGKPYEEALASVVARYAEIQKDLDLPEYVVAEIERDLRQRMASEEPSKHVFMDLMKASGEDNNAKLVAAALRKRGVEANYVNPKDVGLLLSDEYGNAQILPESYASLRKLKDAAGVTVFPGFFGYTKAGQVVTFPRGGSDITGSILAAAVEADVYENFTDVDSVCAVNPSLVTNVKPISKLTYREMRELSYAGFGVLHDEAILPVIRAGIPICIKNTNQPEAPGTMIVREREYGLGEVVGIAYDVGFCTIFVSKYLMNRELGFGRKLLQIIEEEGLSYEHAPSGIDNMSVILRERDFPKSTEEQVLARINNELNVDSVFVEHGMAMIMVVGEGMRYAVGNAATVTKALSDVGVNIDMINLSSSEVNMMLGVKAEDSEKAVVSLYNAFFGE